MNTTIILILVLVPTTVITAAATLKRGKRRAELLKKGLIKPRKAGYARKGEAFSATVGSPRNVAGILSKLNADCQIKGDAAREVNFAGKAFSAKLWLNSFDPATGRAVYCFNFTGYRERRGCYENETGMNLLLTALENMFLTLDRNTAISSFDVKFKTRFSII